MPAVADREKDQRHPRQCARDREEPGHHEPQSRVYGGGPRGGWLLRCRHAGGKRRATGVTDQASFPNPFPSWRREASTMRDRRTKPLQNAWCERRDLNPHGGYPPDPKSGASAVPPLSHLKSVYTLPWPSAHVSACLGRVHHNGSRIHSTRALILPDTRYRINGPASFVACKPPSPSVPSTALSLRAQHVAAGQNRAESSDVSLGPFGAWF